MIEKLKAAGNWALLALGILAAVLFGANTLKKRSQAPNTKDEPPAGTEYERRTARRKRATRRATGKGSRSSERKG